ncbi:hypothetical protein [Flavobacterium geliluteum]|uniref:Uncharacterized protein n=1 Tax=Flavobacterium geliluteum TaxID=2816120 RepID=A0A940XAD3_9FLAO|nr:hypothetical protein [Flavobacterium geliluteum]MBP4138306.1 hypothetical protein [Flavobacterium geliluteum]
MKYTKYLSILVAAIAFTSCKPLKTAINNQFPPLSTIDQQYASIERNLVEISDFEPHVGINIDKDIILKYLPTEIKNEAESIDDENIIIQNIEPKVSLDRQGILIGADFSILIPKNDVEIKILNENAKIKIPKESIEIKGYLNGLTAVSTKSDSLYLRSAVNSLKVKSIKFRKKTKLPKETLAKLISPILKNYIENLNGAFLKKPTVIYTGWGETYKVSLKKMFKDPNTEVIADSLKATRFIKKSCIRIKSDGISVMIQLMKDKPTMDTLTTPAITEKTNLELKKIFNTFNEKYDSTWISIFEPIDTKHLAVTNISKLEISNILNETLSKQIILKQNFIIPEATFNEKLEVKKADIDCQKVRTDFNYPNFNGDSCNWDCMHTIGPPWARIRVEDPVCAATRRACRIRVEAERVAWQIARETARIANQVENEAKVGACNIWRETTGLLALGRFKGDVSGSGKATINLNSFNFNPDLSEIILKYSGGVDAKLKANLELKPIDLGNIFFCFTNYDKKISSTINVDIPEVNSKISITPRQEGEDLFLNIQVDKVRYNASINPSPLHSLLLDPEFQLKCPISNLLNLATIGIGAGKFLDMIKLAPEHELLLLGKVSGSYGIDAIEIPFKPINFKINGEEKKSLIFWKNKSLQFAYFKS